MNNRLLRHGQASLLTLHKELYSLLNPQREEIYNYVAKALNINSQIRYNSINREREEIDYALRSWY
jgi:hypothetical protein